MHGTKKVRSNMNSSHLILAEGPQGELQTLDFHCNLQTNTDGKEMYVLLYFVASSGSACSAATSLSFNINDRVTLRPVSFTLPPVRVYTVDIVPGPD